MANEENATNPASYTIVVQASDEGLPPVAERMRALLKNLNRFRLWAAEDGVSPSLPPVESEIGDTGMAMYRS